MLQEKVTKKLFAASNIVVSYKHVTYHMADVAWY